MLEVSEIQMHKVSEKIRLLKRLNVPFQTLTELMSDNHNLNQLPSH